MDTDPVEFVSPFFRLWIRVDGIATLQWTPGISAGLTEAQAATDALAALGEGRRIPLLVDTRGLGPIDRQARLQFQRSEGLISAVALIATTPVSRLMGNVFLAAARPTVPIRLFATQDDAVAWLLERSE